MNTIFLRSRSLPSGATWAEVCIKTRPNKAISSFVHHELHTNISPAWRHDSPLESRRFQRRRIRVDDIGARICACLVCQIVEIISIRTAPRCFTWAFNNNTLIATMNIWPEIDDRNPALSRCSHGKIPLVLHRSSHEMGFWPRSNNMLTACQVNRVVELILRRLVETDRLYGHLQVDVIIFARVSTLL